MSIGAAVALVIVGCDDSGTEAPLAPTRTVSTPTPMSAADTVVVAAKGADGLDAAGAGLQTTAFMPDVELEDGNGDDDPWMPEGAMNANWEPGSPGRPRRVRVTPTGERSGDDYEVTITFNSPTINDDGVNRWEFQHCLPETNPNLSNNGGTQASSQDAMSRSRRTPTRERGTDTWGCATAAAGASGAAATCYTLGCRRESRSGSEGGSTTDVRTLGRTLNGAVLEDTGSRSGRQRRPAASGRSAAPLRVLLG